MSNSTIYFTDLPESVTHDEMHQLTEALRISGDKVIADKLIALHIKLACGLAKTFYRRMYQQYTDDIIAVAVLGVVEAVNSAVRTLRDNNITPYIISVVLGRIKNYINRLPIVRVPGDAYRKGHKLTKTEDIDLDNYTANAGRNKKQSSVVQTAIVNDVVEYISEGDTRYKTIIQMLLQGHTQTEVAKTLGVSSQTITDLKHKIEEILIRVLMT
jgi:RNA polymerase sigma factor (sigma-70 family)